MKKLALALIGLTLVGSSAFAQTTGVLSRNAVGYIRQTTVKSNFFLLTHNFKDLNGAPVTVTNLIGNQVPNGTAVLLWDPVGQSYRTENRSAGVWFPGTNVLVPGVGFWMKMATTLSHSNNYQIYLMGEVPDKTTLPTNSSSFLPGLNLVANPYPITITFTGLVSTLVPRNGDSGLFWDEDTQTYVTENRSAGVWFPGTNVVKPGKGFWYKNSRATATNWVVVKPYTWP